MRGGASGSREEIRMLPDPLVVARQKRTSQTPSSSSVGLGIAHQSFPRATAARPGPPRRATEGGVRSRKPHVA